MDQPIAHRHRAMLQAVAEGRCRMTVGGRPDLYIDERFSCDQWVGFQLVAAGLIMPAEAGRRGQRVDAALTPAGWRLLGRDPENATHRLGA